ncbi:MAG: L-glyceraldehyde 3-phosphate reductase [Propionibacteriaceae bacterium]|nr:L-glyceraldehyde 3-phosphate reductase [Propionibacteriaceae bacterium]
MRTLEEYRADPNRYDGRMPYRHSGKYGLKLPAISLGLWHNFGDDTPFATQREILHKAFDLGIVHFDLANNYGPKAGAAETNFGRHMSESFKPYRDELLISTKAGWENWPGPYGDLGSRKYLISSLDQSLKKMGLDYVDIFYHHHFDPDTPLEESLGALDFAVRSGRTHYIGISSYSGKRTREAIKILGEMGTPLVIHQPSYSMLNRWIEADLLDVLGENGVGCIAYSALAQGMLTDKYLNGIPEGSRASRPESLKKDFLSQENLAHIRALNDIASERGQSLAQMAIAWVLRDARVTSALIGASSASQLKDSVGALANLSFTAEELGRINEHAVEGGINIWAGPSHA